MEFKHLGCGYLKYDHKEQMEHNQKRLAARAFNVAEQCHTILKALKDTAESSNKHVILTGKYGTIHTSLVNRLEFIMSELNGLKIDTGFDPSGEAQDDTVASVER